MKVNNGYVCLNESAGEAVLMVTEIDGQIPSGSRTSVGVMTLEALAKLKATVDSLYNKMCLDAGQCRSLPNLQDGSCPGVKPPRIGDPSGLPLGPSRAAHRAIDGLDLTIPQILTA